jgi:hypothetical protein
VDYCGFLDMHHHEIAWITVYARQASDDTWKVWRGYGAHRSLHRPCAILLLLWIIMDYYRLLTIMDYHGLSGIIVDYNGLWTMLDYHGLAWIMDYRVSWTVMDYQWL